MDEVDLDELLKEGAEAIVDQDHFTSYLREKSANAMKRFLVSKGGDNACVTEQNSLFLGYPMGLASHE